MIILPNLISKCEGSNCPVKDTCLRHIEFQKTDPFGVFGDILIVPTNRECKNYIKVAQ